MAKTPPNRQPVPRPAASVEPSAARWPASRNDAVQYLRAISQERGRPLIAYYVHDSAMMAMDALDALEWQ